MGNDSYIYIAIGALIVVLLLLTVILPAVFNKDKKALVEQYRKFAAEFSAIFSGNASEVTQLKLQKFVSRLDNFVGKVLFYYGCNDFSVNKQIRAGMEKKLYSYEEFKVLKAFHLIRNQVIHEDRAISQGDIDIITHVLGIVQRLIG